MDATPVSSEEDAAADAGVDRLTGILMPYAVGKFQAVRDAGTRFVQYTSAAAAVGILSNKEVWMRNAGCMNDHSEVRFGLECVAKAYDGPSGQKFREALNSIYKGFTDRLEKQFNPFAPSITQHTYVSCFSEHDDEEDTHGRLSMWRAYGNQTGVALVMNNHPFIEPSDALMAWTVPVAYVRENEFAEQLLNVASSIAENQDWLASQGEEDLLQRVVLMLIFSAVSLKHVGFKEEREWRVVHLPGLYASERLIDDHVVVNGVPQPVFKIPLANIPEENFTGVEPHELIDRIIIGPTQYPIAVRSTFVSLLHKLGVPNPGDRVVCSGIPLRC